jgi:hypothetical protein
MVKVLLESGKLAKPGNSYMMVNPLGSQLQFLRTRMSTMLTDLIQQLQDVHTYHPGDDGRLMVAVPTTPHTIEEFEVREVHHDGPSVVLCCQPLQDEQARPQEEQSRPPAAKTRTCVHNDYEDLL